MSPSITSDWLHGQGSFVVSGFVFALCSHQLVQLDWKVRMGYSVYCSEKMFLLLQKRNDKISAKPSGLYKCVLHHCGNTTSLWCYQPYWMTWGLGRHRWNKTQTEWPHLCDNTDEPHFLGIINVYIICIWWLYNLITAASPVSIVLFRKERKRKALFLSLLNALRSPLITVCFGSVLFPSRQVARTRLTWVKPPATECHGRLQIALDVIRIWSIDFGKTSESLEKPSQYSFMPLMCAGSQQRVGFLSQRKSLCRPKNIKAR